MKVKDFFDNLQSFFSDEDQEFADLKASAYKNKDGMVEEIRIFNDKYEEILIITRRGEILAINISEEKE